MDYKKLLTSSGKFRINLGLDRIKATLELLGNPQEKCKFIHIAGTNGKGSTSKLINDILIEHFNNSAKIGLFTSPHLFSYCERIKINNVDILEDELDYLINKIDKLAKKNAIDLTEFELLTASAFLYFAKNNVKYAILEVGLGGLYDATNIIKNPEIAVITTIDYDHTQRLGNTIEEIAFQKAGIIKENSKVVINKNNLGFETVKKEAEKKNAKIIDTIPTDIKFKDFNHNYAIFNNKKYLFNLLGSHQKDNLSLALSAINALNLNISNETMENALKKASWKFRLEYLKKYNILIDGAHNPNGITSLKKFLDESSSQNKKTIIFGCLNNKDYPKMLEILLKNEDKFFFFEFNYPNSLKFNELPKEFQSKATLLKTVDEVHNLIKKDNSFKVICGSLYMLGQVFKDFS